jgi:hypothetical protein
MLFVGPIVIGVVSVLFVWSLIDGFRHPDRYEHLYDEKPWTRVTAWVAALTCAAILGAAIAGVSANVLKVIAIAGFVLLFVATRFAASAAFNRVLRELFRR